MSKVVSLSRVVLSVAALAAAVASTPAAAADPPPATATPPGFQCHDTALTGSGAGFKSSQEESEEAARQDWLGKAQAIYSDAMWDTAKDVSIECVKQGLYSKCFASAVPCHPKPAEQGSAAP